MYDLVLGHTCFLGSTGFAIHAREFFTQLNTKIPVGIVSTTSGSRDDLTDEQLAMLNRQATGNTLHIVLECVDHPVFYSDIPEPKIAYTVWESTELPQRFFDKLLTYNQVWVPSAWQLECMVKQGFPRGRIRVVPEGVNPSEFEPVIPRAGKIKFAIIGKWEYRKSTAELIQAFLDAFKTEQDVELICMTDNPFPVDGLKTTEERLDRYGFSDKRIVVKHFVPRQEYREWLRTIDVYLSCSRSEGCGLPLLEAIASGVICIASDCSGQTEYLDKMTGVLKVPVVGETKPQGTYPPSSVYPGMWYEPDFTILKQQMRQAYTYARPKYNVNLRNSALADSLTARKQFAWTNAADKAVECLVDNKPKSPYAFVSVWFGKLPAWLPEFHRSCAYNTEFDWLIYTDQPTPTDAPENVRYIKLTKDAFETLASSKTGLTCKLGITYKLCDYKPLYGHLFEQDLTGYTYWGFCDLDVIWGRLAKFLPSINDYDIVTVGGDTKDGLHYRIAGPCTLVKNTYSLNRCYAYVAGFIDVIAAASTYKSFDESMWSDYVRNNDKLKINIILEAQSLVGGISYQKAEWVNGKLFVGQGVEIGLFHLLHKDYNFTPTPNGFSFDRVSVGQTQEPGKHKLLFILGGDSKYKDLMHICADSLQRFSKHEFVVYGYDWDVDFEYTSMHKRRISTTSIGTLQDGRQIGSFSAKVVACLGALDNFDADAYVWVDADSFVSATIDNIESYVDKLEDFPLINSHLFDIMIDTLEGSRHDRGQRINNLLGDYPRTVFPWLHTCLFMFDARSRWFFNDVLDSIAIIAKATNFSYAIADEAIFNVLMWKHKKTSHMDVHDYDVYYPKFMDVYKTDKWLSGYSDYMPNAGISKSTVLPRQKANVYMFHGNKDTKESQRMYDAYRLTECPYIFHTDSTHGPMDLSVNNVDNLGNTYREVFGKTYDYGLCKFAGSKIVIDCGGQVGMFTRWAILHGAEKIYTFEPETSNFAALQRNVGGDPRVILHNKAVGAATGELELFVHTCRGGHSLLDNNINQTQTGLNQKVAITTLDQVFSDYTLEHVDFLKIDTEGGEVGILAGLSDDNLAKIDKIALEYHNMIYDFDNSILDKFVARLKSSGLNVYVDKQNNTHLYMVYAWRGKEIQTNIHFMDGPFCEIIGTGDDLYKVSFVNKDTGQVVYHVTHTPNHWAKAGLKYVVNWEITVTNTRTNEIITKHIFNPVGRRALIWLASKSIGDTLAWLPYVEEFRERYNCEVFVATWHNELFESVYPELHFISPGDSVANVYCSYTIGAFDGDVTKHKRPWNTVPMQQIACDVLGMEYVEVKPRIADLGGDPGLDINKPYVCISEYSTAMCKFWNLPNGWQTLVNELHNQGYIVVSVSKEETGLKNVVKLNNRELKDTIATLSHAKAFIGLGSGLAWVSWALNIPVVMISGFSEPWCEFQTGLSRIINMSVCHGCFNECNVRFDRGDWYWCPHKKDFECSKSISVDSVLQGFRLITNT